MKFEDNILAEYKGIEFDVYKDKGVTFMKWKNGDWIDNISEYASVFLGKCISCKGFYKDSFKDFAYDSVLVAGLGFGLIPNELSEVNKCSKIDVVEISQEVIDYNISSGHLNTNINIIKGDIFEYITNEKYDLIIIDTIWNENEMSEEQVQALTSKFLTTNLNIGGALYIPIKNNWLINK